ncbi:hypothetical protein LEMA_P059910.1 [Plenodomus lingam JN3]|uniref:Extracellular mutant protein 11 C-terminal domain-containing protein n=2 Tax=Leptosphaeria maculans TaxID=5022 RepID=E4ZID6_LEPMJ|nr:hypothetical protein LEMA_P059910.1 [Plenodomus lingam JN3]CBX90957.1 hypothetical protein LEMA_P059910.1 [Plenodomus lingam JN3]
MAANAKVSLKEQKATQKTQPSSGLPARGIGTAQNSSATRQVPRPQHDVYGTDVESLDTSVEASLVKEEKNQADGPKPEQQNLAADLEEASGIDEDGYEGQEADEEEPNQFGAKEIEILQRENLMNYTYAEQVKFLQSVGIRQGFRTLEGDSYPSTTDGQPTQWEDQVVSSEDYAHEEPVVPAHTSVKTQVMRPIAQHPRHYGQLSNTVGVTQKSPGIFQQGSHLRAQQRTAPQSSQRVVSNVQQNVGPLFSNQPPTYTQANVGPSSAIPIHLNSRPAAYGQATQIFQPMQRAISNPPRMQLPRVKPMELDAPANGRAGPGSLRRPYEDDLVGEPSIRPNDDYGHKALLSMSYEDLKKESFDLDPRAEAAVLSDDVLQKPLTERLEYVHKNLDAEKQAKFFSSLPTTEWEDAGDWFLDQFQSIIQRMKEARQTKRKLAQGFEEEVENRYSHVSKKQQQVEAAMDKMKQQGESLVPKSPLSSKSPRPKKR